MFHRFRQWLKKKSAVPTPHVRSFAWIPEKKTDLPIHPKSHPFSENPLSLWNDTDDYLAPAGIDFRILFPILRRLRDYIPDVSAGVWAWVRLCSTPQSFSLSGASEADQAHARSLLSNLDNRIFEFQHERDRGVEALVQCFFLSVFTYGSFCGEVVLHESRKRIDRFIVIDPAVIRFKLDPSTRELRPYQILNDSSLIPLNPASFYYFGLDTDGLSPYGRSPLLALPFVVKLQQQMLADMAKAQHNAGYPAVHFRLQTPERMTSETPNEYYERVLNEIQTTRNEIERKKSDSNFVSFDNMDVRYIGPSGNTLQWSESMQAIGEQVVSALHLAPFMIGRNWGTTQSWGTAQYQLLTNNAKTVQEGAKRLAEWLRNLELILQGSPVKVTHHFAPHHHLDAADRASAFKTSAETLVMLNEKGFIDSQAVKQRMENLLRFM